LKERNGNENESRTVVGRGSKEEREEHEIKG